ncbi:hypothetical protein [Lysobacter gummosus]|uniref:hypothetical protein n=1 Tax=Lysobacter gummosus TaxID=262324 RepID=UPI00363D4CE4
MRCPRPANIRAASSCVRSDGNPNVVALFRFPRGATTQHSAAPAPGAPDGPPCCCVCCIYLGAQHATRNNHDRRPDDVHWLKIASNRPRDYACVYLDSPPAMLRVLRFLMRATRNNSEQFSRPTNARQAEVTRSPSLGRAAKRLRLGRISRPDYCLVTLCAAVFQKSCSVSLRRSCSTSWRGSPAALCG